MEKEKAAENKDILEKLQEFCKENNLILNEYKIASEDVQRPYQWRIIITANFKE